MPRQPRAWLDEFANFQPIEDGEPTILLPDGPTSTAIADLRVSVRKAAIDYFFKHARTVADSMLKSSPVAAVLEMVDEAITYSEPGDRHVLIMVDDDVQLFRANRDGQCPGLVGFFRLHSAEVLSRAVLQQVFIFEDQFGILEPVSMAMINNRL